MDSCPCSSRFSVLWLSSEEFVAGQNEARRELIQTRQHRKLIPLVSRFYASEEFRSYSAHSCSIGKAVVTVLRAMRAPLIKASADDLDVLI